MSGKRACKRCRAKGYIEAPVVTTASGIAFGMLTLCPECRDVSRYSRQVQYRYAFRAPEPCDVISLDERRAARHG